jgi:hypothetical protein
VTIPELLGIAAAPPSFEPPESEWALPSIVASVVLLVTSTVASVEAAPASGAYAVLASSPDPVLVAVAVAVPVHVAVPVGAVGLEEEEKLQAVSVSAAARPVQRDVRIEHLASLRELRELVTRARGSPRPTSSFSVVECAALWVNQFGDT